MGYKRFRGIEFFKEMGSEERAREWIWQSRFGEKGFQCKGCTGLGFWQHKTNPEIRTCSRCGRQLRLRAGTIFENSKLPLLIWLRAIYLMMQGKRGISALELQRVLGMKSYQTSWLLLQKIRTALKDRDSSYKLKQIIELDGAQFGHRENQRPVLIAVESKDWVDEKGRPKSRAGFAKVTTAPETRQDVQEFVNQAIEGGSFVNTDGKMCLRGLENVDVDYQEHYCNRAILDHWLPWVHKFISNAKAWMVGTHHGIEAKYLEHYLAEYTYRFNRRHDPNSLFHRALTACALAAPRPAHVLSG